jgi:hypothetical protein
MGGFKRVAVWAREAVMWGAALWHVLGWFGLAAIVSGLAVSIGGAVWAVITGVPIPIAIMAAYCTFVAGVYLMMAPVAFRALGNTSSTNRSRKLGPPNYIAWRGVRTLTLLEASYLWAEVDPAAAIGTRDSHAWYRVLSDAITAGELNYVAKITGDIREKRNPQPDTKIDRQESIAFAKKRGFSIPNFLHDD